MSRTTTKIIIAQKDGTVVGQYYLGQGEHLIGREDHCTIQLEADQVSREHARLIISADAIEIEDLDSTSGTYLDGVTVKGRIPVQSGQKLWISDLYIDIERQGFGGLIEGSRLGDGRFTLKRELGVGGMGVVWLALDGETQENFAIKLISGEISANSESLEDLQREVNKSHKLVHPNIVRMGYFWKEEGEPAFISLEYVDGTDLHQLRSDSPHGLLVWEEVQRYMIQLCDALEYAHSQKVAHRDIKPSNFMINNEDNLKLADFGIAASLANTASTFTSNTVLYSGTPPYMSPQQLEGKRPRVTDDIYSVGATFYELLTSKPPFYQGDIAYQVRHTEAAPMGLRLRELGWRNEIPEYVSAIVMACLQKDPGKRPQSMRVIREWIQEAEEAAGLETTAANTAQTTRVPKATPTTATTKIDADENTAINIIKMLVYITKMLVHCILAISLFGFVCIPFGASVLDENTKPVVFGYSIACPWGLRLIIALVAFYEVARYVLFIQESFRKWITGRGIIEVEIRKALKKPTGKLTKADLEKVKRLYLSDNQLTDLRPLARLKLLEELILYNNPNLHEVQINRLKKALPKCKIYHDFD